MDGGKYTLSEHLTELRTRLIKSFGGILLTTLGALAFAPQLLDYSVQPLVRVLSDRNRIEAFVVHDSEARAGEINALLEKIPQARAHAPLLKLTELTEAAKEAVDRKRPIDLVLVSTGAVGRSEDLLASDVLEGIDPAPYVVYLIGDPRHPMVPELMLEGANVILDPPRGGVLKRMVRRAAGAAGKSASADKLVVLSPLEPFFAYLKIALVVGLFLACPIWLYQAWRFVAPGLYPSEKGFVAPTVMSGSILFIAGGAFAYFFMFPIMFDVLINDMMPSTLAGTFTVDKYLGLLLRVTVAFGVVFELPLALALLSMVGIVTADGLKKFRKYAIVGSFIVSAILTPADPFTQVAMALPLIVFYEVGIIAASIVQKRRRARDEEETALEQT